MPLPEKIIHENWCSPVSFEQFQGLSEVFMSKAKKRFNTNDLDVKVTLYDRYKMELAPELCANSESFKKNSELKKKVDKINTIRVTDSINDVRKEEFDKAASVCVSVHPKVQDKDAPPAFGLATFKDRDPSITTLYLQ